MRAPLRWAVLLVAGYVLLIALGRVGQLRHGPGYLAVGAIFLLIGAAVWWLATRGQRGPGSGRDPRDVGIAASADRAHMGPGQH